MSGEEQARRTRTDTMIAQMEHTIAEAKDTTARMRALLAEIGVNDVRTLEDILARGQCSPGLRTMMETERERLEKDLDEGTRALAGAGAASPRRRAPRRGARRI